MWQHLLNLLAVARRPLVFVDFETAGLGGKPPVEFACLVYAPWDTASDDDETRRAARVCPPGLSYAVRQRLDPGQPIDWGASKVHGIRDVDVRGMPRYDSPDIQGFFQGYALGDSADNVGPAIWCGHNIQGADLPWGRMWGYFLSDSDGGPPTATSDPQESIELDAIDTMRLQRRLAKEHPRPLAVDAFTPAGECVPYVPTVHSGLDVFATSLVGLHYATHGTRHEAHGAMADCEATARALCRLLDAWSPLWPPMRSDLPASANLSALLAALDAPPPGQVSWDGWFVEDDPAPPEAPQRGAQQAIATGPRLVWAKGKHRGRPAHRDAWVMGLPRLPTGIDGQGWCSRHTADILMGLRPLAVAR